MRRCEISAYFLRSKFFPCLPIVIVEVPSEVVPILDLSVLDSEYNKTTAKLKESIDLLSIDIYVL